MTWLICGSHLKSIHDACQIPRPEAVVDVDHADAGGATIQHAEEGGAGFTISIIEDGGRLHDDVARGES